MPGNLRWGGKHVDLLQKPITKALRQVGCSVSATHMVGKGFVDLVAWSPFTRATHMIEVKTGTEPLSRSEQKFHAKWAGPIAIVRSIDEALVAIGVR